jgi:hypothetical protein
VLAVVQALHPDTGYLALWRQALRVVGGEIEAVSQARVQDSLPQDLPGFTGRTGELDRLRHAARVGEAVVISAIEGMAGVGKTPERPQRRRRALRPGLALGRPRTGRPRSRRRPATRRPARPHLEPARRPRGPGLSEQERAAVLDAVHELTATHPALAGRDTFPLPYVTECARADLPQR